MSNIYIVGAGGLGRGLAESLLLEMEKNKIEKNEIYFIDDNFVGKTINGVDVIDSVDNFTKNTNHKSVVYNAIGEPNSRYNVQQKLEKNNLFDFPNFIPSSVFLPPSLILGKGNIISRGTVLSANVEIGDFNLIHYNSSIGHDLKIKSYNCIYPLASLSGYVEIGNCNMVGAGSVFLPQVKIGDFNKIGANSTVTKDFGQSNVLIGTPAKNIK